MGLRAVAVYYARTVVVRSEATPLAGVTVLSHLFPATERDPISQFVAGRAWDLEATEDAQKPQRGETTRSSTDVDSRLAVKVRGFWQWGWSTVTEWTPAKEWDPPASLSNKGVRPLDRPRVPSHLSVATNTYRIWTSGPGPIRSRLGVPSQVSVLRRTRRVRPMA